MTNLYIINFHKEFFQYYNSHTTPNFIQTFWLMNLGETDIVKFYHKLPDLFNKKFRVRGEILK